VCEDGSLFHFKIIKSIRNDKPCPLKFIKAKDGNLLTKGKDIMERWKEHFQEVLQNSNEEMETEEGVLRSALPEENGDQVTVEELRAAIEKTKLGKAAEHHGIAPEIIKYTGPKGFAVLLLIIQLAWKTKMIPKEWEVAIIIPIFNKGDNRDCDTIEQRFSTYGPRTTGGPRRWCRWSADIIKKYHKASGK
jgi:hypothetical protein